MNPVDFLKDSVDTPALLINEPVLQKNLKTMAAYCKDAGIALRPHTKTHKCPEIARRQLDLGAIGLVCAKLGEAEAMAEAHPFRCPAERWSPVWGSQVEAVAEICQSSPRRGRLC